MVKETGMTTRIKAETLKEPQTAHLVYLQRELQTHPARGLTPSKLACILDEAEKGDIRAQADLFEDMEEKDGHIAAELGKRRRALLLPCAVLPPDNPTALEKSLTDKLRDLIDAVPDFEDVLFDMTDAIGKGFAALEIEWKKEGGWWLPAALTHRPQSWFCLHRGERQELRLRTGATQPDGSIGEPLCPLGWLVHTHRAKSGWLERSAMFRQLVWPYLFKNYSVGDLAEFLEIYGIPVRVGRYPASASEEEKSTLMRALVGIGHNAAGIIPEGMNVEFMDAARGDPEAFKLMMDWCERTQSKVILGGTLTSGADGKSSTNALGNVHNEVRHDLRDSDIRQLNSTLTRQFLHAIATVNGLMHDGLRAPVMRLQLDDTEDLATFAQALPALVNIGFQIPVQWAQERLGIPQPEAGEDVLHPAAPMGFGMATSNLKAPLTSCAAAAANPSETPSSSPSTLRYITKAEVRAAAERSIAEYKAATAPSAGAYLGQAMRRNAPPTSNPAAEMAAQLEKGAAPAISAWLAQIRALVDKAGSLEDLRGGLEALLPDLKPDDFAEAMAQALTAAQLAGRYDILNEAGRLNG
ncbi:MAG: DUF935 domain-containing protein [Ottowia sp.]|nr:DUF935 domain-containing protein [Ottowia sp.]